jgi:hypothetical protein
MAAGIPIFSNDERKTFFLELSSKFRSGIRSPEGFIYICITFFGVGWASWQIPVWNGSHISPETLGIYVIGFVITVGADSLMIYKKSGEDSPYETAIGALFMILSGLLFVVASVLSWKRGESWPNGATPGLALILIISIWMTLVLTGFDSKPPKMAAADKPLNEIKDRGTNG